MSLLQTADAKWKPQFNSSVPEGCNHKMVKHFKKTYVPNKNDTPVKVITYTSGAWHPWGTGDRLSKIFPKKSPERCR